VGQDVEQHERVLAHLVERDAGAAMGFRPLHTHGQGGATLELEDGVRVEDGLAQRAGLKVGDRIVSIDGRTIEELGAKKAESALVLSVQNQSELVLDRQGKTTVVKLDRGFVWLSL
jgi:predicted metalloprotease with PDZ domain